MTSALKMSPTEAPLLMQEQLSLESESDDTRSDISSEDSDDEDVHSEYRPDPAEDICDA